jgi:hypothetical protein
MKTIPLLLALGTAFLCQTHTVQARAGELKEASVALPAGYPAEATQQVLAALRRPDCKYLGGNFINWHTGLSYQGSTQALSMFLGALAKCPGATVSVSLTRDPLPKEGSDWSVSHEGLGNHFHVRVNLDSKQIDLSKLVIPAASGPALPSGVAKLDPAIPAK